jgi:hypothetical protein
MVDVSSFHRSFRAEEARKKEGLLNEANRKLRLTIASLSNSFGTEEEENQQEPRS